MSSRTTSGRAIFGLMRQSQSESEKFRALLNISIAVPHYVWFFTLESITFSFITRLVSGPADYICIALVPFLICCFCFSELLRPANEVCEGNGFTGVCLSTGRAVSVQGLSVQGGVSVWGGGLCPGRRPCTLMECILVFIFFLSILNPTYDESRSSITEK